EESTATAGKGVAADQPKAIQQMLQKNAPATNPEQYELLKNDIANYRSKDITPGRIDEPVTPRVPGDPRAPNLPVKGGTVASARTDVAGLEGKPYGGASPEAL